MNNKKGLEIYGVFGSFLLTKFRARYKMIWYENLYLKEY